MALPQGKLVYDGPAGADPALLREANTDVIARMMPGCFPYLLLILIVAGTTDYPRAHPVLFWGFVVSILTSVAMRIVLAVQSERALLLPQRRLDAILIVTVALPSFAAGVVHASAVWFYSFESWPYVITMLWIVGCASGATISFTPSFMLLRLYLWATWTPVFAVDLWRGGQHGYTVAIATAALFGFLHAQGRSLHSTYWRKLRDRALEAERTRELEAAKAAAEAANRPRASSWRT
jgi:hypothetical protein